MRIVTSLNATAAVVLRVKVRNVAPPVISTLRALVPLIVTGAAAMLLSIDDTWKPNEIRDHLIASADECAGLRGLCRANGRLNLRRAVCGPFSVTVPGPEAGFKSGEKITVKWQLEYDSPVVKTVDISIDGQNLTPGDGVPAAAEYCEVQLPSRPISNAVLRVKCREKNLYTDYAPFVIE